VRAGRRSVVRRRTTVSRRKRYSYRRRLPPPLPLPPRPPTQLTRRPTTGDATSRSWTELPPPSPHPQYFQASTTAVPPPYRRYACERKLRPTLDQFNSSWRVLAWHIQIFSLIGPILWGHSGPLCHALSLLSSLSWTSMRRRRATVAACDSSDTW